MRGKAVYACPFCKKRYKEKDKMKKHILEKEGQGLLNLAYCLTVSKLVRQLQGRIRP